MKAAALVAVALLLAGCASSRKAGADQSVGRVEVRQERGYTVDVLVVSGAVPDSLANGRVIAAFKEQNINPFSQRPGIARGSVPLLSCESRVFVNAAPNSPRTRAPTSCRLMLDVVWHADSVGTQFHVSAWEAASAGPSTGSGLIGSRSKSWSYVLALGRALSAN